MHSWNRMICASAQQASLIDRKWERAERTSFDILQTGRHNHRVVLPWYWYVTGARGQSMFLSACFTGMLRSCKHSCVAIWNSLSSGILEQLLPFVTGWSDRIPATNPDCLNWISTWISSVGIYPDRAETTIVRGNRWSPAPVSGPKWWKSTTWNLRREVACSSTFQGFDYWDYRNRTRLLPMRSELGVVWYNMFRVAWAFAELTRKCSFETLWSRASIPEGSLMN